MTQTFTFSALPQNADELRALPEFARTTPFQAAALTVLAICRYETSPRDCIDMLNALQGPRPLSVYDQQFLRDRLGGKGYVPRSYFAGSTPANDYQPSAPYTITVFDNPYSYPQADYATLYIRSGGADTERPVTLRLKPSTGEWFLWNNTLMADIRPPRSADPWA